MKLKDDRFDFLKNQIELFREELYKVKKDIEKLKKGKEDE